MGYAYVIKIGETGRFKLGNTDDPEARTAAFQTISTEPLSWYVLIESNNASAIETVMKDYLEEFRVPRLAGRELFEPPVDELEEAISVARDWNESVLPDLNAVQLLKEQECDPELALQPTEEHWSEYRQLLRLRQIERRAQQAQIRILTRWQLHMGRASSLHLIATWKSHPSSRFDKEGFLKAYPHLEPYVDEFTTHTEVRRFLPHW